jgi:RNA polymerase sigma factor (TIGR02999 family)
VNGYDELKRVARQLMLDERAGHTLTPTGLLHTAILKLLRRAESTPLATEHLYAMTVKAMEQVLIDHARTRGRIKRGGDLQRHSIDLVLDRLEEQDIDVEQLHDAIHRLSLLDATQAEMIRMRYLLDLPNERIAEHFGLSVKTVENKLSMARAWLEGCRGVRPGK